MGLIYEELKLGPEEVLLLRYGAGYFPNKVLVSHGGLLYLTTHRVVFRPHKLDISVGKSDSSVHVGLADVVAVGSTPRWRVAMGRRFLRVDDEKRSYLFLFSLRHPAWRGQFIQELRKEAPAADLIDGWGAYRADSGPT